METKNIKRIIIGEEDYANFFEESEKDKELYDSIIKSISSRLVKDHTTRDEIQIKFPAINSDVYDEFELYFIDDILPFIRENDNLLRKIAKNTEHRLLKDFSKDISVLMIINIKIRLKKWRSV